VNEPETLRKAAVQMREEHGPDHPRHAMWEAIAHHLEQRASVWHSEIPMSWDWSALAIADAYLEAPR